MTDKKRVTILVDATSGADQNVFNFGAFPATAELRGADAARPPHDAEGGETLATGYQMGRKSIMEGVGATELLHMHRKSLAGLAEGAAHGVNMDNFSGVTLSRRHRVTEAEYNAERDEGVAMQLESFSFGAAE